MPIMIRDKSYTLVAERLQMVHQSGKTFEIVASEPLQAGERWVWRVTVKIDERQFIGSAEVHLNAKPGSADATDCWACAETSAVGRALGMANFGSIESIASADEIVRGQAPAQPPASAQQKESISKLCQHLGKPEPENTETMSYASAKEMIATLSLEYRQSRNKSS